MPMIPFIGVRISWLIVAKNSLLARFAASARLLASLRVETSSSFSKINQNNFRRSAWCSRAVLSRNSA